MLTISETARATGRSPDVLRRWLREGRLEGCKVGSAWLVPPDALLTLDAIPRVHRRRPAVFA